MAKTNPTFNSDKWKTLESDLIDGDAVEQLKLHIEDSNLHKMPAALASAGPDMKFEVLMKCLAKHTELFGPNRTYILKMVRDYLADAKEEVAFLRDCAWPACMNDLANIIVELAMTNAPSPQDCIIAIRAGKFAELGTSIK